MSIKEPEDTTETSPIDTVEKEEAQAAPSKNVENEEEDYEGGLC